MTARQVGKGRVVFFPWDIDRTYWEVLCVDHGTLLRNAVMWATNEEPVVRVQGAGLVEVTVWTQKQSLTVHLVNLSNPMMMKGPGSRNPPDWTAEGSPEASRRARSWPASSCWSAEPSRTIRRTAGAVEVHVPSIGLHEVVAFDLV